VRSHRVRFRRRVEARRSKLCCETRRASRPRGRRAVLARGRSRYCAGDTVAIAPFNHPIREREHRLEAAQSFSLFVSPQRWQAARACPPTQHHEDRTPTHGYEATHEAAMAAFAADRRTHEPSFRRCGGTESQATQSIHSLTRPDRSDGKDKPSWPSRICAFTDPSHINGIRRGSPAVARSRDHHAQLPPPVHHIVPAAPPVVSSRAHPHLLERAGPAASARIH